MGDNIEVRYKQQQRQALNIIHEQVLKLRKKMCAYGVSNDQFRQIMQKNLGSILWKGKHNHYKNINDMIIALGQYILKKKGKTLQLLIQVITKIDIQFAQLESSEQNIGSNPGSTQQAQKHNLKLEGKRGQNSQNNHEVDKKKTNQKQDSNIFIDNKACYVKLESLQQLSFSQQENSKSKPRHKKR